MQTEEKVSCFNWENEKALDIQKNEELVILCKLIQNFMAFYDLDYSENVFKHEVNDKMEDDFSVLKKINVDLEKKD